MAARRKKSKGRAKLVLFALLAVAGLWALYGALYVGPEVNISIVPSRAAIGAPTEIQALFNESKRGVSEVRLTLTQGERELELSSQTLASASPWTFWSQGPATETMISGTVGRGAPEWLEEGTATLRAEAKRVSGPLRGTKLSTADLEMKVILRPPAISIASMQHYLRQGGAGMVLFRVGEGAIESGVQVGETYAPSYPLSQDDPGARVALFGVPWDVSDSNAIRVVAEDEAGNRSERAFVDLFKSKPPKRDVITLPDSFLEKVVPAVEANTPSLKREGDLLERYLAINRDLRVDNRAYFVEAAKQSSGQMLWSGPFLQLPNSRVMAGFAEVRSYRHGGGNVDLQTHLGLDFASVRRAEVPAPNTGNVVFADFLGIYGNAVVIDHGLGMLSVSAHLSSIDVAVGDTVNKGQVIGRTGATGLAGGDHLHFGLFIHGVAVDPVQWLDAKWIADNLANKLMSTP